MIPISKDAVIEHRDESNGIAYQFRPLRGDLEIKLNESMELFSKGGEKLPEIRDRLDSIIDSLLVGWKSLGETKLPEFPSNGKPSDYFGIIDKKDLLQIILKINRLEREEIKN